MNNQSFGKGDAVHVTASCEWKGNIFVLALDGAIDSVVAHVNDCDEVSYWVWVNMPDNQRVKELVPERLIRHRK